MAADSDSHQSGWSEFGRSFPGNWASTAEDSEQAFRSLFAPVDPWNRWPLLNPVISIAGGAAVLLLAGVAAASLVVMSFALLAVVFLLNQVFGYEVTLPPVPR